MSRAVWVDYGNDFDPAAASRNGGIDEPYFDVRDPRVTNNYLLALEAKRYKPGIYACWNWPEVEHLGGAGFAQWVSDHLKPFTPNTAIHPRVHLNAETKDTAYIAAMLKRWRELRPTRVTLWTMEGHQAPVYASIAKQIIDARVDVGPQCYVGNMERIESAFEVKAWAGLGIPVERIKPFYDAAQLGAWWEGTAFTQGRLP